MHYKSAEQGQRVFSCACHWLLQCCQSLQAKWQPRRTSTLEDVMRFRMASNCCSSQKLSLVPRMKSIGWWRSTRGLSRSCSCAHSLKGQQATCSPERACYVAHKAWHLLNLCTAYSDSRGITSPICQEDARDS